MIVVDMKSLTYVNCFKSFFLEITHVCYFPNQYCNEFVKL